MQRCPKCGYREGIDWPSILMVIAFGFLYCGFIVMADFAPRSWRWAGLAAVLIFGAGTTWRSLRNKRIDSEYKKLHPPITERVKDHFKANPANSH